MVDISRDSRRVEHGRCGRKGVHEPSPVACELKRGGEGGGGERGGRIGILCGGCGCVTAAASSSRSHCKRLSSSYSSDNHCVHPPSVRWSCHGRVRIAVATRRRQPQRSWRAGRVTATGPTVPVAAPRAGGRCASQPPAPPSPQVARTNRAGCAGGGGWVWGTGRCSTARDCAWESASRTSEPREG